MSWVTKILRDKKYASGSTGKGDLHSEALGVSGLERTGNILLGEKKTRELSEKGQKYDLGRSLAEKEEDIKAPPLSDQEQAIIARMKELAMGNPELGEIYTNFTKNAIEGIEGITPGLERDIAEQEEITKEQIARGLGSKGDKMSTAGVKTMGKFNEWSNMKREMARQDAIRTGEGLLSSRSGRMTAAAATALGPMAQERGMGFTADMQNAMNTAGQRAGQMELAGQVGSAYLTSKGR